MLPRTVRSLLKPAVQLVALMLLCSCATLDIVHLRFKDGQSGELTMTVHVAKEGLPNGKIPAQLIHDIQACQFNGRLTERVDHFAVDVAMRFDDASSMAQDVDCLPTDWVHREIAMTRETGLFYNTYVATVWFELPLVLYRRGAMGPYLPERKNDNEPYRGTLVPLFPMHLTVDMPANVTGISSDRSKIDSFQFHTAMRGNRATIDLAQIKDNEDRSNKGIQLIEQLERDSATKIPNEIYRIEIRAREARYELGTIGTLMAVIGTLFGSGVLVQLVGYLRRRRSLPAEPSA